jgi:hypothetical protein
MAGLKGKSGPPGNMNAFKHGLAAIQKRREESITTEHEESVRQQILDGLMIGLNDLQYEFETKIEVQCSRAVLNLLMGDSLLPHAYLGVGQPAIQFYSPEFVV